MASSADERNTLAMDADNLRLLRNSRISTPRLIGTSSDGADAEHGTWHRVIRRSVVFMAG